MSLLLALLACSPPPGSTSTSATSPPLDIGLPHRPEPANCASIGPPDPVGCPPIDGIYTDCQAHADCGSDWCVASSYFGCFCMADECDVDDDCGPNRACVCGGTGVADVDHCQPAECRVDSDCASGLCLPSRISCGGADEASYYRWYCATDQDTCRSDEVCTGEDELCVYDDGRFQCSRNAYGVFCDR